MTSEQAKRITDALRRASDEILEVSCEVKPMRRRIGLVGFANDLERWAELLETEVRAELASKGGS